jgi:LDH2 family malate/lactate/ureidoglycolate dehydrogenase
VGSWLWDDPARPTNHGAAFIAIDVSAMAPLADFVRRTEALVDEIHRAPRADGVDQIRVPGEIEWEKLARAEVEGISLPSDVIASLREAATLSGQSLEQTLGL